MVLRISSLIISSLHLYRYRYHSLFLCYLLSIAFFALLPVVGACLLIFRVSFPFAHFVCTLFFFGFVLNDVFFSFLLLCVCVFILFSSSNFCSVFRHSLNSFPHLSHVQPLARQIDTVAKVKYLCSCFMRLLTYIRLLYVYIVQCPLFVLDIDSKEQIL